MNQPDYQKQNEEFVTRIVEVCRDRGRRAELRRWWSEQTRHYALPVLGRLFAIDDERKAITAALYAVHAGESAAAHRPGGPSVGQAALILAGGSTKASGFDSMERHFRRLLASGDLDDLAGQLHRLVKRLQRESIAIDYVKLLGDLRQWSRDSAPVKTRWALAFWQGSPATEPAVQP